jgi:hypothetical protein
VKRIVFLLPLVLLAGCAGKTRLVPQAYMPEPPAILMQAPKELHTIKQEPKPEEAPKDD